MLKHSSVKASLKMTDLIISYPHTLSQLLYTDFLKHDRVNDNNHLVLFLIVVKNLWDFFFHLKEKNVSIAHLYGYHFIYFFTFNFKKFAIVYIYIFF